MVRKITLLFGIMTILLLLPTVAFAGVFDANVTIDEALANSDFYEPQNVNGKELRLVEIPTLSTITNPDYTSFGCLVYGYSSDPRYLGQTLLGENYTNVEYPPEVPHTGDLEDQEWVIKPWEINDIRSIYGIQDNSLDGTAKYKLETKLGIMLYLGCFENNPNCYKIKGELPETAYFWDNIEQYVHILAPPTKYAWGIGRMWRVNPSSSTGYSYMTVPLKPGALLQDDIKNLVVRDLVITPNPVEESDMVTVTANIVNEGKEAQTTLVRYYFNSNVVGENNITIPANGSIPVSFNITAPLAGFYPVEVLVNPNKDMPPDEINILNNNWPGDNYAYDTLEVQEEEIEQRPIRRDSKLHLQAYSQEGEDVFGNWCDSVARPPYTAKWGDDVKATLTVDAPTPPTDKIKAEIRWWHIDWARITYPEQNPNFSFGCPLPPIGTVTKPMNISDRKATITFEEDWAMDGAQIYCMIHDELMAEHPKEYPISVEYKVTYQYSHRAKIGGVWRTVTEIASYTDTATAGLMVDGTGIGFYAS